MESARRVDVDHRHGQQQLPAERRQPANDPPGEPDAATTINVVGPVDRGEQGVEVLGGPGGLGRGHEDHRQRGPIERAGQRRTEAVVRLDDDDLAGASSIGQHRGDPLGDGEARGAVAAGDRDDARPRAGQRAAAVLRLQGIVDLVRRHAEADPEADASQAATSSPNAFCRRRATGPGTAPPIARPSIRTTGMTSIVVPVSITSSA